MTFRLFLGVLLFCISSNLLEKTYIKLFFTHNLRTNSVIWRWMQKWKVEYPLVRSKIAFGHWPTSLCFYKREFFLGGGVNSFFKGDPYVTYWGRKCVSNHQIWCFGSIGTCLRHSRSCWVPIIGLPWPDFSTKLQILSFLTNFKAFISIFLYYTLYQGKLKVITRPQCGLHFFIRSLVLALAAYKALWLCFTFKSHQSKN